MKLLSLFFDATIEDIVREALESNGINCYMKTPKILGRIGNCEPLLDTHIWPGYALWYLIPLESSQLEKIKPALKKLAEEHENKAFRAFIFQTEEIL